MVTIGEKKMFKKCLFKNGPLNWVLLVYVAPRATHFTGYCCWFMWGIVGFGL
jgi:hypothetical protein